MNRRFESLEQRRLLAVDLVTEFIDPPAEVRVGEETEFTLRVSNVGDEDAFDVLVESDLTEALVDAEWSAVEYSADPVRLDFLPPEDGFTFHGNEDFTRSFSHREFSIPGDINGDGFADIVTTGVDSVEIIFGKATEAEIHAAPRLSIDLGTELPRADQLGELGDLNADGFDDFWIRSEAGVFIVFGAADLGAVATASINELTTTFLQTTRQSSLHLNRAGDFNGDGIDDLILRDQTGTYFIYGGGDVAPTETSPSQLAERYGYTFAETAGWQAPVAAGDINGDGFDDLFVTEDFKKPNLKQVVLGRRAQIQGVVQRESLFDELSFELTLPDPLYAESFNTIGDINADGADDFAFETFLESTTDFSYVIAIAYGSTDFGSNGPESIELQDLTLLHNVALFDGTPPLSRDVLLPIEDFNGDGVQDLAIGRFQTTPLSHVILYGGDHLTSTRSIDVNSVTGTLGEQLVLSKGDTNWNQTLQSQLGSGDVNGDGVNDLLAGSNNTSDARIVFGKTPHSGHGDIEQVVDIPSGAFVDFSIRGHAKPEAANTEVDLRSVASVCFEQAICPLRPAEILDPLVETMGDGNFEVQISNPHSKPIVVNVDSPLTATLTEPTWQRDSTFQPIEVRLLDGDNGYTIRYWGNSDWWIPKYDLSASGDLTGDGLDDFIFGGGDDNVGLVYLQSGSSESQPAVVSPTQPAIISSDKLRAANFAIGDFNGDGYGDIYAWEDRPIIQWGGGGGRVELQLELRTIFPIAFGGGDLNGDGFDDLLLTDSIQTIVVFGHETEHNIRLEALDESLYFEIDAPNVGTASLSGDVNGDGFDDLLFKWEDEPFFNVLFGRSDLGELRVIERELVNSGDGIRISTDYALPVAPLGGFDSKSAAIVGDINGDGFDDTVHSTATGAMLLFGHEEVSTSLTNGVRLNAGVPLDIDKFGDFNGDGLDDLLLAPSQNEAGVFVVFGSHLIDHQDEIDVRNLDGLNGVEVKGISWRGGRQTFSNAGDLNDDGIEDLVANGWEAFSGSTELYVVYGSDHSQSGEGDIDDPRVKIEPNSTVRYIIQGELRDSEIVEFKVSPSPSFVELDATNNSATVSFRVVPSRADLNADGLASALDFEILRGNFGRTDAMASDGDLNDDGRVDFSDFLLFSQQFGV